MGNFIKKIIIFLLPLLLLVLFPVFIFCLHGEFMPFEKIKSRMVSGNSVLLGKMLPLSQDIKIEVWKARKPDVTTLGNSRVLAFREEWFQKKDFYNGGGMSGFNGYTSLLKSLQDTEKPKVILIGLEHSYFSTYADTHTVADLAFEESKPQSAYLLYAWRNFYADLFTGKYPLSHIIPHQDSSLTKVGLLAHIKNSGMRNDGSYSYGDIPGIDNENHPDFQFQETLRRMEKGTNLFYFGDSLSQNSFHTITEFLAYCQSQNIYVIGFLPPYAQEIYEKMKISGKYHYVFELEKNLRPLFEKYGYNFFNFSDMSTFGGDKSEIVDGLHASETAYKKLFVHMVKNDKVLPTYAADISSLENSTQ